MTEHKTPVVTPGQKFRHKRNNAVYIVRQVYDEDVELVSENGEASMRIQLDSISSGGFEPIYGEP